MAVWRLWRVVAMAENLFLKRRSGGNAWEWKILDEYYVRHPEVLRGVCPYCGRAYRPRGVLKLHIMSRHSSELDSELESIALALYPRLGAKAGRQLV